MEQGCILEICSQVGGLPWSTFHLSRFQNFSQGNNHFSEIGILGGKSVALN